jgi:hypothetical protein
MKYGHKKFYNMDTKKTAINVPMPRSKNADRNWAMDNGSLARFSCSFGLQVPLIQNRPSRSRSPCLKQKRLEFNRLP